MKSFVLKLFLYLYIIISSKCSITGQEVISKENCTNEECLKIILYNNGTINKTCVMNDYIKKDIRTSIVLNDMFIIFDCLKKDSTNYNKCQYNLNDVTNNLDEKECKNIGTSDDDNNECCYLEESYNNNNNNSCIEVNKYEYERFKWNDIIRDNFSNINSDFSEKQGYIKCNSNISKINILILISLLIFYI